MSVLPLDCRVMPDSYFLMMDTRNDDSTFKEKAETILNFSGSQTTYLYNYPENCTLCEQGGQRCGFNPDRNQTFCINHGMISYIYIIHFCVQSTSILLCDSQIFHT
jgi:hypothetical protein